MNSWIILCLCNDLQRFHFLLSAFVLKWGEVRAGSVQGKSHKAAISLLDLLSFVFTVAHTWLLRDLFFFFFLSKETWPPLFGDIYQMHCVQDFCSVSVCAAHAYVWIADWHWAPGAVADAFTLCQTSRTNGVSARHGTYLLTGAKQVTTCLAK